MAKFKVPATVRANAKRGLEMRRKAPKSKKGGLTAGEAKKEGIGSGVQRAANLKAGSVSQQTIVRMHGFFSRHGQNIDKARSNPAKYPRMRIADLLWGGASGERWAASKAAQIKKKKGK